ncbi:MAG: hypothetical protein II752_03685 [Muribaculaceae bacterium]|nr:hypothetical protein [Muribaculaceae bacterium]
MKEFLKNRDHDLLASASQVIGRRRAEKRPLRLAEIALEASLSPAPHYYLTFDYAYRQIRRMRRDPEALKGDSLKALQMREILDHVNRLKSASEGNLSDNDALTRVLASSKASRFFISEAYAVKLVRRLIYKPSKNTRK